MTKRKTLPRHTLTTTTRTSRPSPRIDKGTGKAPIKDKEQKILWARANDDDKAILNNNKTPECIVHISFIEWVSALMKDQHLVLSV